VAETALGWLTIPRRFANPQQFSGNLVEDDGTATNIRFTDIPANRGMLAVKKEFPDAEEFQCMSFRLLTFSEVIKNRQLIRMRLVRKRESGEIEVHDAVINALAMAPFSKSGALDKPAFLALVKSEHKRLELVEASKEH
jgi:hypothetical protein